MKGIRWSIFLGRELSYLFSLYCDQRIFRCFKCSNQRIGYAGTTGIILDKFAADYTWPGDVYASHGEDPQNREKQTIVESDYVPGRGDLRWGEEQFGDSNLLV